MSFNKFTPKLRLQKFISIIAGLAIVLFAMIQAQLGSQPVYGCMHARNWWMIIPLANAQTPPDCCYTIAQCQGGGGGIYPDDSHENEVLTYSSLLP